MTQPNVREPGDRPFPWLCPVCLKHEVFPDRVPYTAEIKHDGNLHRIHLPSLAVPRCRSCGELLFDVRADEEINDALRAQIRLLAPTQIHTGRIDLGLSQGELAKRMGVAEATLSRWETGALIQSRAMDNLLRLYFALPEVRKVLRGADQDPALGAVVTPEPAA